MTESPKSTKPVAADPALDFEMKSINVKVPKARNMGPDGLTEFPAVAVLIYANGVKMTFPFKAPKASAASGKINAWAGGKIALEGNEQAQVGINITILD